MMSTPIIRRRIIGKKIILSLPCKQSSTANVTYEDEDSDIALIGSFTTGHKNEQILNSDCIYHICLNKKFFSSLEELEGVEVYIGNDTPSKIKGIDKVRLQTYSRTIWGLSYIQFVQGMKKNVILLRVLNRQISIDYFD